MSGDKENNNNQNEPSTIKSDVLDVARLVQGAVKSGSLMIKEALSASKEGYTLKLLQDLKIVGDKSKYKQNLTNLGKIGDNLKTLSLVIDTVATIGEASNLNGKGAAGRRESASVLGAGAGRFAVDGSIVAAKLIFKKDIKINPYIKGGVIAAAEWVGKESAHKNFDKKVVYNNIRDGSEQEFIDHFTKEEDANCNTIVQNLTGQSRQYASMKVGYSEAIVAVNEYLDAGDLKNAGLAYESAKKFESQLDDYQSMFSDQKFTDDKGNEYYAENNSLVNNIERFSTRNAYMEMAETSDVELQAKQEELAAQYWTLANVVYPENLKIREGFVEYLHEENGFEASKANLQQLGEVMHEMNEHVRLDKHYQKEFVAMVSEMNENLGEEYQAAISNQDLSSLNEFGTEVQGKISNGNLSEEELRDFMASKEELDQNISKSTETLSETREYLAQQKEVFAEKAENNWYFEPYAEKATEIIDEVIANIDNNLSYRQSEQVVFESQKLDQNLTAASFEARPIEVLEGTDIRTAEVSSSKLSSVSLADMGMELADLGVATAEKGAAIKVNYSEEKIEQNKDKQIT